MDIVNIYQSNISQSLYNFSGLENYIDLYFVILLILQGVIITIY